MGTKAERIRELKKQLIGPLKPTAKQRAVNKAARHQLRKLGIFRMAAESRANISKARTGLHHSPETIAKISATRSRQCTAKKRLAAKKAKQRGGSNAKKGKS